MHTIGIRIFTCICRIVKEIDWFQLHNSYNPFKVSNNDHGITTNVLLYFEHNLFIKLLAFYPPKVVWMEKKKKKNTFCGYAYIKNARHPTNYFLSSLDTRTYAMRKSPCTHITFQGSFIAFQGTCQLRGCLLNGGSDLEQDPGPSDDQVGQNGSAVQEHGIWAVTFTLLTSSSPKCTYLLLIWVSSSCKGAKWIRKNIATFRAQISMMGLPNFHHQWLPLHSLGSHACTRRLQCAAELKLLTGASVLIGSRNTQTQALQCVQCLCLHCSTARHKHSTAVCAVLVSAIKGVTQTANKSSLQW